MADSENIALVKRHLAGWENMARYIEELDQTVSEDLVWLNTGLPDLKGIEQARGNLRTFAQAFGSLTIEYLNITEEGNQVWTERIDYIRDHGGNTQIVCPCMGVFEIKDGKITSWRDYFDASPFLAAFSS